MKWNFKTGSIQSHSISQRFASRQKGMTLLEIILTLVIAGMLAALVGVGMVNLSTGFVSVRQNTSVAQKVQMATSRVVKELSDSLSVVTAQSDNDTITFVPRRDSGNNYAFTWGGNSGDPLILDTGGGNQDILMNNVHEFRLQYVAYRSDGTKDPRDTPTSSWAATDDQLISVFLTSSEIGTLGFNVNVVLKKHE